MVEKVREVIEEMRKPLVIHHYDADGIIGGAIITCYLDKLKKSYEVRCVQTLTHEIVDRVKNREVIFVDLGSGIKEVNELFAAVIDHHQLAYKPRLPVLNPELVGLNGGIEISSAGLSAFLAKDHFDLGVAGAHGDVQLPLQGLNLLLAKMALENNLVEIKRDLPFFGRSTRSLYQFLHYAPFSLPPDVYRGLDINKPYNSLPIEEKKNLIDRIVNYLLDVGDLEHAFSLLDNVYFLRRFNMEAKEFAFLVNATGRAGRAEVGLKICREEVGIEAAKPILRAHQEKIREALQYAKKDVIQGEIFDILDGRGRISDSIIGSICGILVSSRPIIGIAKKDKGWLKISMRAPSFAKINIGEIMRRAAEKCGGSGGGHRIAGGAEIEEEKLLEFLDVVRSELEVVNT